MVGRLHLITAPTMEPVSLATAKQQLAVDTRDHDDRIASLITAARMRVETVTGRQLMQATWEYQLDAFPARCIDVPRPPLISVTSISYVDANGTAQTWGSTAYTVDASTAPSPHAPRGRIDCAYSESYPSTRSQLNAVTVRYVAGYSTSVSQVPEELRQAMLLLIGHWFENRASVVVGSIAHDVPQSAGALLDAYRTYPVRMVA